MDWKPLLSTLKVRVAIAVCTCKGVPELAVVVAMTTLEGVVEPVFAKVKACPGTMEVRVMTPAAADAETLGSTAPMILAK